MLLNQQYYEQRTLVAQGTDHCLMHAGNAFTNAHVSVACYIKNRTTE